MCSLRKSASTPYICGGVLIDSKWMMTAAHCLDLDKDSNAELRPFVICNALQRENSVDSENFTTKVCYAHHSWNGNTFAGSDIAICELNERAELPIPKLAMIDQAFTDNDEFSVLGWGKTSFTSGPANCLQIGEHLSYRSNSECNNVRIYAGQIKDSMVCAGRGVIDTCEGDSGGPLFIPHTLNNPSNEDPLLDVIVGITSFGHQACQGAPGVYTRISCYRPWIECVMQGKGDACNIDNPCQMKASPSPEPSPPSSSPLSPRVFDPEMIKITIATDDFEKLQTFLDDGLNPNTVFSDSMNSLLILAAEFDAVKSAEVLIKNKADLEYKNDVGETALARATVLDSVRVTQLLIDNQANIESKNQVGDTPLSLAVWNYRTKIITILLENEANIESRNFKRITPLHLAALRNFDDIARVLIDAGANVNSFDEIGFTALHHAAEQNSIETTQELIAAAANPSSTTNRGFTPLHLAAQSNSIEIAKELISNNVGIEARTNIGDTPLSIAAYFGSFDVLKILLDGNAMVDSMDNVERTPLHYASARGHVSVVRVLLISGASKTKTDVDGNTPLDVICTNQFLDVPCKDNVIVILQQLLAP